MTKRMLVLGLVAAALAAAASCKKDDGKDAVKKFHAEFAGLHEDGVKDGFFQCLYGEPNLPTESGKFIEQIKRRFDSDPAGFIEEKSEGCRVALEATVDKVRLMTAPTAELGSARDAYTDAATAMADAWTKVHQTFVDFKTVDDARIEFNGTYAPLLEKAGNRGWAVIQKFEKPEELQAFLELDPGNKDALLGAYRYLNFVLCILKVYDVDPNSLLIEDTKAADEGRAYLLGVKALRDKLTSLCTGAYGTSTNILEWVQRISTQCYGSLEAVEPAKPELFEKIMLWWSSDGARDRSGEAYSSYAAIGDTCLKQTIDLDEPLKEFLKVYGEFVKAASGMDQALRAAQ
ncbi:MAG: hypothetical protein JXB32_13615 [Deltaproteobacteria bacterium]|nr:hypothetical protein [Deltaproteobacteria bacterium]